MSNIYKKMDFGFNNCKVTWGPMQHNVTEADMVKLANDANANGFTYQPELKYGALLVGNYPEGCHSPANQSWPFYLRELKTYKLMDFGFNNCKVTWGPMQHNVTEADMVKLANDANANGFTYQPELKYGALLVGNYPEGCKSPANLSWPLYLAD
jgi:hypothetical protein